MLKRNNKVLLQLAKKNLLHRKYRSIGLMLLVTLLSFFILLGTVFTQSMQNGITNMKDRFGADFMIVPKNYKQGMEAILLKGEPSCFYFSKNVETNLEKVEGISEITSQFFLTSISAECCDTPVQLIGIDPETDFAVQPWIRQVYDETLKKGEIIAGSKIDLDGKDRLKFFDREYPIVAQLDDTGTGLDEAVFTSKETMEQMFNDAKAKGLRFVEDVNPTEDISSVLLRIEPGYDRTKLKKEIRKQVGAVRIIEADEMIGSMANKLENMSGVLYILIVLFWIIHIAVLFLMFSVSANERKKEFAIYRVLGSTKRYLARMLSLEGLIVCFFGAVAGTVLATVSMFPILSYLGNELELPYVQIPAFQVIKWIVVDIIFVTILGPCTSVYAIFRAGRGETYLTMRQGD